MKNLIGEIEDKVISQVQLWMDKRISNEEILSWSREFYNTVDFDTKPELSRDRYRLRLLHSILYWYLASLDRRFYQREHGEKFIASIQDRAQELSVDFHGFYHGDFQHIKERAEKLKNHYFYEKHAHFLFNRDMKTACADREFMRIAFRKNFKYQGTTAEDMNVYLLKKYGSRKGFGIEQHVHEQTDSYPHYSFKGFTDGSFFQRNFEKFYMPFEFQFDIQRETCFIAIGEAIKHTEENKNRLMASVNEPCPDKFEINYKRFRSFTLNSYYTYMTKPKLKTNRYQKGFFGYWQ